MRQRTRTFPLVLLLSISGVLTGCITLNSSVEPVRFFTLANPSTAAIGGTGVGILAGPFELPEYLNRPQLATLGTANELLLSDTARWAEPLGDSVAQRVASQLRTTLNRQQVYAFPSLAVRSYRYHATGGHQSLRG
jgi:uncharacterized lipoprotein YmbA